MITDLSCPRGLAVDAAGRLLVVGGGSLLRVNPQTGVSSVLVEDLPPFSPFYGYFALGASGSVYFASYGPPALYRFDLETFYIPAAAHKAGAAGTQWVTDLTIHNRADTAASFSVDLLPKRQDNSAPETVSFSLEPSSSVGYDDALDGLFDFSGAAALRVRATSGDLLVGSRTYNDQPEGTYGQHIAGFPEDEALVSGGQGLLIGLSHGADYRTNIGFASACGATISVEVTLYSADGVQLGQRTVELAPYSYDQLTDIFSDLSSVRGSGELEPRRVVLRLRIGDRQSNGRRGLHPCALRPLGCSLFRNGRARPARSSSQNRSAHFRHLFVMTSVPRRPRFGSSSKHAGRS